MRINDFLKQFLDSLEYANWSCFREVDIAE